MHGIKDEGLLESALGRHANKRTAWSCCVLFLKVTGIRLPAEAVDLVKHVIQLAEGRSDEVGFAAWLRRSRADDPSG